MGEHCAICEKEIRTVFERELTTENGPVHARCWQQRRTLEIVLDRQPAYEKRGVIK